MSVVATAVLTLLALLSGSQIIETRKPVIPTEVAVPAKTAPQAVLITRQFALDERSANETDRRHIALNAAQNFMINDKIIVSTVRRLRVHSLGTKRRCGCLLLEPLAL